MCLVVAAPPTPQHIPQPAKPWEQHGVHLTFQAPYLDMQMLNRTHLNAQPTCYFSSWKSLFSLSSSQLCININMKLTLPLAPSPGSRLLIYLTFPGLFPHGDIWQEEVILGSFKPDLSLGHSQDMASYLRSKLWNPGSSLGSDNSPSHS